MKKVAVISYGMSDTIIPLLKYFSLLIDNQQVTLFMIYAQNKKKEGIVNFDSAEVEDGFLPKERLPIILGIEIMAYVSNAFDIKVFVFNNLKFKSFKNWLLSLALIRELSKYDLIHVNGTDGTLLLLLPFLEFKKWIMTVHDFNLHIGEGGKSVKMLDRIFRSRAGQIIIQNKTDYRYVEENHPELIKKTDFIPFGYIDIYRFFLREGIMARKEIDILFFGRISEYKGLAYLLDAVELLNAKGLHYRVVIAGNGNYDFGLHRLEYLKNVEFINRFIFNDELAALINQAKVVVCPYVEATQSGVLMTAFAFNKPVVASSVGGFRDVIINGVNGFLVPPKAPEPLANAIEAILQDPGLNDKMTNMIQDRKGLKPYDWSNIVQQLQSIYNRFL